MRLIPPSEMNGREMESPIRGGVAEGAMAGGWDGFTDQDCGLYLSQAMPPTTSTVVNASHQVPELEVLTGCLTCCGRVGAFVGGRETGCGAGAGAADACRTGMGCVRMASSARRISRMLW